MSKQPRVDEGSHGEIPVPAALPTATEAAPMETSVSDASSSQDPDPGRREKRAAPADDQEDSGEPLARRARLQLVESAVQELHGVAGDDEDLESGVNTMRPEVIIQEEDWVNYAKDEADFDQELVAKAKREELDKLEKLKVYEVVDRKEFENDPAAIKIGTKWVVTNKGTKVNPMIKARFVGKEFADDTKK